MITKFREKRKKSPAKIIRYPCRKNLAENRTRHKGRFVKLVPTIASSDDRSAHTPTIVDDSMDAPCSGLTALLEASMLHSDHYDGGRSKRPAATLKPDEIVGLSTSPSSVAFATRSSSREACSVASAGISTPHDGLALLSRAAGGVEQEERKKRPRRHSIAC